MEGFVDHLSSRRAIGWAKTSNGAPALVEVSVNGKTIAKTLARIFRSDVGECGFDVSFDQSLPLGAVATISVAGEGILSTTVIKPSLQPKPIKHRLRVPLYASPFRDEIAIEEQWDRERINRARTFAETGLLRVRVERPDFPEIAKRLKNINYGGQRRIMDAWRSNEDVRTLATDPAILRILGELYGREAIPMQTLNFPFGTEQSTHADTVHFNSQPAHFMCGVWVALEPIGDDNGPLHYYPGSNNLPIIDLDDIGMLADGPLWSTNYEHH
jgi:hypothetical protein